MPGKHLFEYAVVRLVPRVEREEFINIGVILLCQRADYLNCKFQLDSSKISLLCTALDQTDISDNIEAFKKICLGKKDGGAIAQWEKAERFRWLTAHRSASIQTSRPHHGFSDDLDKTLDKLFQELVL